MNCYQMKMLLSPYANDELSDEERETVEIHLAGCAACRRALEEIAAMHGRLALLHTITLDTEIADGIISRIKQMTDTQAAETAANGVDAASAHAAIGSDTGEEAMHKETESGRQITPDGDLLPGWGLHGEP